ncbi:MAG: biopolymer transporter TolR [Gillisia sp.]
MVIGGPIIGGSALYNEKTQTYSFTAGESENSSDTDQFQYLFKQVAGDFIITANLKFIGAGENTPGEIGLMIKKSEEKNAAQVSATLRRNGSTSFQWREMGKNSGESPKNEIEALKRKYEILQLERISNKIIMRAAHPGEPLQIIGTRTIKDLNEGVLVGLYIASSEKNAVKAEAWNVRIDKPVPESYDPNKQGWIACRLEIMDIETRKRKVIYTQKGRFEAPNWMPDGEKLLFNMDGSLYTISVEGGEVSKFDTGFADNLNNDHGISLDGKMLAFSHHRESKPGYGSTVYVMPMAGGTPKLITEDTPSYWHGWAPGNDTVAYVATRKDNTTFDIYKKSVHGGKEIALTNTKHGEHVDGSEYSPDGKYIYYNGSASGTMQLWRMKPDGTQKEQLTFDENNNWFPHISPDGKWIVYISFLPNIPVNDHPSYKRVTLNLMPAGGGVPKVIAYLYGGQGTINVPSWAPDSKHFAFVSNSGEKK